jgi:hypothetical protein
MIRFSMTAAVVCAGSWVGTAWAQQEVYSHFALNQTAGIAVTSPDWEVGEYVTLVGGAQAIGTLECKFAALSSAPNGDGTLNLTFYNDQAGAPGSTIATFATPVSLVGTGPIVVPFNLGTLNVPGSVWVAVRFVETSGGIAGVRTNTLAPTVGSVSATRAYRQSGVGAWGTATVGDWLTMHILAAASCYANCDGSTTPPVLNINDYICFQSRFASGDSYANCDGSTAAPILNVNDFICFQSAFAQGCP